MAYHLMKPRFPLGTIAATPAVLGLGVDLDLHPYLHRHHCGDWGDLDSEDEETNETALKDGERRLSCYQVGGGRRIYIITEHDRSSTCLVLSKDY